MRRHSLVLPSSDPQAPPLTTSKSGSSSPRQYASPPASPDQRPSSSSQNNRYFFDDDMVVFLVEGQHFKIHRHFLVKESTVFRAILASHEDSSAYGSTEAVIPLPDILSKDFETLLDFFYEGMHDDYDASLHEWISILLLATQFEFTKLRTRAIREIGSEVHKADLGPVEKIALAQKFHIPKWLPACYQALCQRTDGLNSDEAELLGSKTTNGIWRAREAVREDVFPTQRQAAQKNSSGREDEWNIQNFNPAIVTRVVQRVFWPPPPAPPRSLTPSPASKHLPVRPTSPPAAKEPEPPSRPVISVPKSPTSILSGLRSTPPQKVGYFERRRLMKKKKQDNLQSPE